MPGLVQPEGHLYTAELTSVQNAITAEISSLLLCLTRTQLLKSWLKFLKSSFPGRKVSWTRALLCRISQNCVLISGLLSQGILPCLTKCFQVGSMINKTKCGYCHNDIIFFPHSFCFSLLLPSEVLAKSLGSCQVFGVFSKKMVCLVFYWQIPHWLFFGVNSQFYSTHLLKLFVHIYNNGFMNLK